MTISTQKIWNDFNKELLSFIQKRVKDENIAQDLLQDIFVKIHLKLSTLSHNKKLTSWVYQIARNSILDYYKKNKRPSNIPFEISAPEEPKTFNDEFGKCLKPFIDKLPEIYRNAILQVELGPLSQKEFAERSNISYSGAKSRIQRGRQKLLELFDRCCRFSTDKFGNIVEYQRMQNHSGC